MLLIGMPGLRHAEQCMSMEGSAVLHGEACPNNLQIKNTKVQKCPSGEQCEWLIGYAGYFFSKQ